MARHQGMEAGRDGLRRALAFYAIAFGLALAVRFAAPVVGQASPVLTMLTPAVAVVVMLAAAPEGGVGARLAGSGSGPRA